MTTTTPQHDAGDADAIREPDDDITTGTASPDPHIALRRLANDLVRLWALCGKPACRRAQSCRRNPRSCARRYGPLAPEAARHGMLLTLMAIQDGVHPDELCADQIPEIAALDAWAAHIEAMVAGGSPVAVDDPDRA